MAKAIMMGGVCPMAVGVNILSGKWKLQILWNIYQEKTIRFNELQRRLGSITTKTLTSQLRELEDEYILKRVVYPEVPPRVEYSFTELGRTLEPVLGALYEWGKNYQKEMVRLSESSPKI